MKKPKGGIAFGQLMCLAFLAILSPGVRLLPGRGALLSGRAVILAGPIAAVIAAGFTAALSGILRTRKAGQSGADLIVLSTGPRLGRLLCALLGLYLVVYTGFTLRSGAERLISCVYSDGSAPVMGAVMILISALAASGKPRALAGTGRVLAIGMILILALVCLAAAPGVRADRLWPLPDGDVSGLPAAALLVLNLIACGGYFLLLLGPVEQRGFPLRPAMIAALGLCLTVTVLSVLCVGTLSAPVTGKLQHPFFSLIRNVSILKIVERFEALVLAVWICADFAFLAALLSMVRVLVQTVTGKDSALTVPVCAAAAWALGSFLWDGALQMRTLSDTVIPRINTVVPGLILPLLLLLGRLRKKF